MRLPSRGLGWGLAAVITAAGCNALFEIDQLQFVAGSTTAATGGGSPSGGGGEDATTLAVATVGTGGGASSSGGGAGAAGGAGGSGGDGGDGGGGSGSGGAPTDRLCDARFEALDAYRLCSADATSCTFFRTQPQLSCMATCAIGGLECEAAHDQEGANHCVETVEIGCAYALYNDIICRCRKGCGAGGPCAVGAFCIDGECTVF